MAFTYDVTTDRGKVRFQLCDTVETSAMFSDAEIDMLLSTYGSVDRAVVRGAQRLLMNIGRFARSWSKSKGDESHTVDETAAAAYLQSLIDQFSAQDPVLPPMRVSRLGKYPSDCDYDT